MAPSLAEQIDRDAIAVKVQAGSSEEVIRLLAGKLETLGYVLPSFAEAVLAREARLPTGLPMGRDINVAVPHTDPAHVVKPGIAVATLTRPVDLANMEDPDEAVAVGLVFMLALNDKDRQIDMLQQIIMTIQDEALSQKLLGANSPDELLELLDSVQQGEE